MAFRMRGQGATEYLVLLAVVLIIALVAISLLGFFPSMAADAKITQSNTYWRGEAAPISIQEHSIDAATGATQLVLLNNDALGTVTILNISLSDTSSGDTVASPIMSAPIHLSSGAQQTYSFTAPALAGSDTYQYNVKINYISPDGLQKTESGAQPIIGKYSS